MTGFEECPKLSLSARDGVFVEGCRDEPTDPLEFCLHCRFMGVFSIQCFVLYFLRWSALDRPRLRDPVTIVVAGLFFTTKNHSDFRAVFVCLKF